jgi:hypothetical protein
VKIKLSECPNQARAGAVRDSNIHEASFIERRLFYLKNESCYKGMV